MSGRRAGGLERWVPGLRTLREYRRAWLVSDLVAGLVLTALLVPVGMGYAQAAGLPPITGLYATIVPLVVYAVLGPSRVMVLGPDSSLAAVIAAVILPLGGDDPETAVALAGALAVLTGLVILVAGVARLGFVTELLSRPVQLGYLCGIAVTILVGQLPRLCGFSIEGRGLLTEIRDFVQGVADGRVNRAALAVGLTGIVVILVLRRLWPKVPGVMVAVVVGIAAVALLDLEAEGVQVVGVSPGASPPRPCRASTRPPWERCSAAPWASPWSRWPTPPCCPSPWPPSATRPSTPTRSCAPWARPTWPPACSRASPSPPAPPGPRWPWPPGPDPSSPPLVGAVTIALLLVLAPGALRDLPLPMLAAIVITAAIGLIDVAAVRRLYRVRRSEFVL